MSEKTPSNDPTKESVDSIESPKSDDVVDAAKQQNESADLLDESIEKKEESSVDMPGIKNVIQAVSGGGSVALNWVDSFRSRFPTIVYIMGLLFVLFIVVMIYLFVNLGHSRLFAFAPSDPGMPRSELINQTLALNSSQNVKTWAESAAARILTFAFDDIDNHLTAVKPYFTSEGYTAMYNSFPNSSFYKEVKKKKYIVESFSVGASAITEWDMSGAVPWWKITVPMVMNVKTGRINEMKTAIKMVNILVSYIPLRRTQQVDGEVVVLEKEVSWWQWFSNLPEEFPKSMSKFFGNVKKMISGTFESKQVKPPCLSTNGCSYTVLGIKSFSTRAVEGKEGMFFSQRLGGYESLGEIDET